MRNGRALLFAPTLALFSSLLLACESAPPHGATGTGGGGASPSTPTCAADAGDDGPMIARTPGADDTALCKALAHRAEACAPGCEAEPVDACARAWSCSR